MVVVGVAEVAVVVVDVVEMPMEMVGVGCSGNVADSATVEVTEFVVVVVVVVVQTNEALNRLYALPVAPFGIALMGIVVAIEIAAD